MSSAPTSATSGSNTQSKHEPLLAAALRFAVHDRGKMPKATHTKKQRQSSNIYFAEKHVQFEEAARRFGVKHRSEGKNTRGVAQHVVINEVGGILRWPTWYEHGCPDGCLRM